MMLSFLGVDIPVPDPDPGGTWDILRSKPWFTPLVGAITLTAVIAGLWYTMKAWKDHPYIVTGLFLLIAGFAFAACSVTR